MARSRPNPSSGGEKKTPLIIALVFFVLATIIAGVLAFTYQGDLDAVKKESDTAKEESKTARAELSKEQGRLRLYQVILGTGTEDDRAKLAAAAEKDALRDEHAKIIGLLNAKLQTAIEAEKTAFVGNGNFQAKPAELFSWPWPANGEMLASPSPGPLMVTIVKLRAEREMAMRKLLGEQKTVSTLENDLKAAKELYDTERTKLSLATAAIPKKLDEIRQALAKDLDVKKQEFLDAGKEYRPTLAKARNDYDLAVQTNNEINLKLKGIEEQLEKERSKQADKDDTNTFDNPKGDITAVFPTQNTVEINLGSADNVKSGLTFNIFPRDVKDRGFESRKRKILEDGRYVERVVPKAKIEVIEVIGPYLSRARITETAEALRDPILKSDLLYNSAWRKGSVDHVVLYGIFDIDGDGSDDIKTVARQLNKMGIVVDGYYDLSSRKWIGGGPTERTTFAVEGAVPSATAGDLLVKEKGDLINGISAARDEAKKKGNKVIRYREFFPSIGYTVKFDVNEETINQAAAKYLRTNATPVEETPK